MLRVPVQTLVLDVIERIEENRLEEKTTHPIPSQATPVQNPPSPFSPYHSSNPLPPFPPNPAQPLTLTLHFPDPSIHP